VFFLSLAENLPLVTGFGFFYRLIVKKHIRELQFCAAGLTCLPPNELRIRRRRNGAGKAPTTYQAFDA
jgi:hypothetical protein